MTEENIYFSKENMILKKICLNSLRIVLKNDNFNKIEVEWFLSWHVFIRDNTMQWSGWEHLCHVEHLLYGDRSDQGHLGSMSLY